MAQNTSIRLELAQLLKNHEKMKGNCMSFHKNFRTLRKGFHLSQEQMAKILHVSRTTVSNYERGRMEPSIQTLKDIAQFFGISLDMLLR